jgi:uncharacterized protein (TIGR01244 family)
MNTITYITPEFAITGELSEADFAELAARGFKAVINNRPDGEAADQQPAQVQEEFARRHGLAYVHIPATSQTLFNDQVVEAMAEALKNLEGPILAHCKSGMRSAILWGAASARTRPVAEVLEALGKSPFDLSFLVDELEQQAARSSGTAVT